MPSVRTCLRVARLPLNAACSLPRVLQLLSAWTHLDEDAVSLDNTTCGTSSTYQRPKLPICITFHSHGYVMLDFYPITP